MFKQKEQIRAGWLWLTAGFVLLTLGSNHLYGYSLLDSFLNYLGMGSWKHNGVYKWHLSSLILIPLLLLCMLQIIRLMKARYPRIGAACLAAALVWSALFPKLTEIIVKMNGWIIK